MRNALVFFSLLTLAVACTPEGTEVPLEIVVQPKWASQDLAYSSMSLVQPETGDTFQWERSDMLLSEFALIKEDGSLLPLADEAGDPVFAFFTKGKPWTISIPDNIPKGHYQGITFTVGLDSAVNFGDPSQWRVGHPLNPTVNNLHWGWQGGYVFMAIEGFYQKLGVREPWLYHVALLENRMPVRIEGDLHLDGSRRLVLNWNADRLFYGVHEIRPAEDGAFSHSTFDGGVAHRISENAQQSFSWVALENKK
ncbi:MAG: hypothetical protein RIR07_77 [Bacteroidota bacterium]|jgi:hypothetical protein